MAGEDTVASLGFEVNSQPLDDAKQKLTDVATQADKTGKAVDDFNQSVGKTADAASKANSGLSQTGPALSAIESAARRAGVSVAEMQARTAAFNAETGKLASAASSAGTTIGNIAKESSAAAPAITAVGAASKAAAVEHAAHSKAATELREALHGLAPIIGALGGSLGGLREYTGAARLGIEALAVVAGGAALIELAKLGDEVERTKNRLAGLTGSTQAGAQAYDAIKAAAKATGIEASTLEGAFEKAKIGMDDFADKNVIYADTAANAAKRTNDLVGALGTVGTILQTNLASADEEKKALDALASSFQKTGKFGVDAFQAIQAQSPSTALAIANAFGSKTVTDFLKELAKAPITIDQFVQQMARVKPQVDAGFDPSKPKTFSQALSETKAAWGDLLEELAKAGSFDVVKNALVGIKNEADSLKQSLDQSKNSASDWSGGWVSYFRAADQGSSDSMGSIVTAIKKFNADGSEELRKFNESAIQYFNLRDGVAVLASGLATADSDIVNFAQTANEAFASMANAAISAAQKAASAVAAIAQSAGSSIGGAVSAAGGAGGTEGIQLGPSAEDFGGGGSGSSPISSGGSDFAPQGTDAGAANFDLGISDLPAFADGGQLTVTGTGGTDSQLVQFKATPGEVVSVSTPGQVAAQSTGTQSGGIQGVTTLASQPAATATGVVSATPDDATLATVKEITDAIDQSTIDISKKVLDGSNQIVDAINKLSAAAGAPTLNPSTGLPVSSSSSNTASSGGFGSSGNTKGLSGASGGGFNTRNTPEEKPIKQTASPDAVSGTTSQAFGVSVKGASFGKPNFNPGAPVGQYTSSVQNSDGSYQTGVATVGPSGGVGNPFDTGTSAFNDYGLNSYAGFDFPGSDYSGGDFGVGGSSALDVANQYMADAGGSDIAASQGTDAGAPGFDLGIADMGYFASGGSFTVGGDGGTDTTPVFFHATKGETVEIHPPGGVTPSNVIMPTSPVTPVNDPSQSTTQNITKNVVINVQAGIQAEQFIRSRAQIARGF